MSEQKQISTFNVIFGDYLLRKGEKISVDELGLGNNQRIGVYFSAHWCPPCRAFTPKLVDIYNEVNASGKKFEVVFVSSDRNEQSFDAYYRDMPWLAVPFEDRGKKEALTCDYGISGIPTLLLLDSKGVLITKDGRERVSSQPFPWEC